MEMEEVEQTPFGIRAGDLVRVVRPRPGLSESGNHIVRKVHKRREYGKDVYYLTIAGGVGQYFDNRFQKISIEFTPDKEYEDIYE